MMNYEERYEYVISRCGEIKAERRKKRITAAKIAVPVCGIAAVSGFLGAAAHYPFSGGRSAYYIESSENAGEYVGENASSSSGERSSASSKPVESKDHSNVLNIGEIEMPEDGPISFFEIPCFYEEPRDKTLEHFGLSPELSLSGVIEELKEVPPQATRFYHEGMHGFNRWARFEGDTEGEIDSRYDFQVFRFENEDGSKWAEAVFCHIEFVPWWINHGIGLDDTAKLPKSVVAGEEMLIGERSSGGYYAEFRTGKLSTGLTTVGCTAEETVAILEYLAEYVGAACDTYCENYAPVGTVGALQHDVISLKFLRDRIIQRINAIPVGTVSVPDNDAISLKSLRDRDISVLLRSKPEK